MNQNNIITSTIKTKIGNFKIELNENTITKFIPTKKNLNSNNPYIKSIEKNLNYYFCGKKRKLKYKINPEGTYFQKKVWEKILKIKYGCTSSYYEIAKLLSSSPRAVGNACAKNPCILFIPCHRVIYKNNLPGNYVLGIKIKTTLLNLEKDNE